MTDPTPERRWYSFTPDRFVLALLAVECLLWLSERFQWPSWHKGYAVAITVATVAVAILLMLLWFIASLIFRWPFQFSIRSLLVMTLAVAVPCGWLSVQLKEAKEQRDAVAAIKQLEGSVAYADEVGRLGNWEIKANRRGPVLLWDLLGDDFFADVVAAHVQNDEGLKCLKRINHVRFVTSEGRFNFSGSLVLVTVGNSEMSDAGLEHLEGLTQLQRLDLGGSKITDAGLQHLKGLLQVKSLDLSDTKVTDAGLDCLRGLSRLESLNLGRAYITDAGLKNLKGLKQLGMLLLRWTQVTDAGIAKLQQALPNCKIKH